MLNLTEVGFIDTTGIRVLMIVLRNKRDGDEVIVVKPRANGPRRALDIVGFPRFVTMVETIEEAL